MSPLHWQAIREVHALSRRDAVRTRWTPTDAIISISSPDELLRVIRPPTLWGAGAVLWVAFHDITEPLETDQGVWETLSDTQADTMIDFVHSVASHATRLIIHCEEGRSRSVAAAVTFADLLAIPSITLERTPRPFSSDLLARGNALVQRQLRAAWARHGRSSRPDACPLPS